MDDQATVSLVTAWQAAANQQHLEQLLALSDPQIVLGGPRGAGQGHHLLREWVGRAGVQLTPRRIYAHGEQVVIAQQAVWRDPETGAVTGEREVATRFRVVGQRIAEVVRYDNIAEALAAAGLTVADAVKPS